MRLEFLDQLLLLTKSQFLLFWGTEEFSPWCIVVGRIHADTKQYLQDGREGSVLSLDQLPFWELFLNRSGSTCLMICLDEKTICQEQFGGTAQWYHAGKPQPLSSSLHCIPQSPKLCFPAAEAAPRNEIQTLKYAGDMENHIQQASNSCLQELLSSLLVLQKIQPLSLWKIPAHWHFWKP